MDALDRIAESPSLMKKPGLVPKLGQVVRAFGQAGLGKQIDHIDDVFGPELEGSVDAVQTLVAHYGQELVGSSKDPAEWNPKAMARLQRYVEAANAHGFPESELPFRVLLEFRRRGNARSAGVDSLLEEAQYLTPEEVGTVVFQFIRYSEWRYWVKTPTAGAVQIARTTQAFLGAYNARLCELAADTPGSADAIRKMAELHAEQSVDLAIAAVAWLDTCGEASPDIDPGAGE